MTAAEGVLDKPVDSPTTASPLLRRRRGARSGWVRRDTVSVLLLMSLTVLTTAFNMAGYPRNFEDEGTYTSQAWSVAQGQLSPYVYWYDHPFLGWVQISLMTAVPRALGFHGSEILNARLGMLPFAMVAAALLYVLARRTGLPRGFAAAATVVWALSPLVALYNRQVFLDTAVVPWVLASFVLAMSPRRNLLPHIGAGICFAVACLTKETVVIVLPALLWVLWHNSDSRTRSFSFAGFLTMFAMFAMAYPLFAVLRGELLPGADHVSLWEALTFQFGRESGGSIFDIETPKFQVFQYWWDLDAAILVGGVVASVLVLFGPIRRLRPIGLVPVLGTLMVLRPGWLPGMFIITFLPFIALAIGGLAYTAWDLSQRSARPVLRRLGGVLVASALLGATVVVAPLWAGTYSQDFTRDDNRDLLAATTWVTNNLSKDDVVMTDNTMWLDFVDAGWQAPFGVLWHVKLDTDPEAQEALPNGWRDIRYIVSSRQLRTDVGPLGPGLPQARQALVNSRLVKTFGDVDDDFRIEVREVVPA